MQDCLFCKMIRGEIPVTQVLEGERFLAFRDIDPQAPDHVLVISKTHTSTLAETHEEAVLLDVMNGVRETARVLNAENFRMVINNGSGAGQTVFHVHAHLLSGRPFTWPPG